MKVQLSSLSPNISHTEGSAASLIEEVGDVELEKFFLWGNRFLESLSAVLRFCVDVDDNISVSFLMMKKKLREIHPMYDENW